MKLMDILLDKYMVEDEYLAFFLILIFFNKNGISFFRINGEDYHLKSIITDIYKNFNDEYFSYEVVIDEQTIESIKNITNKEYFKMIVLNRCSEPVINNLSIGEILNEEDLNKKAKVILDEIQTKSVELPGSKFNLKNSLEIFTLPIRSNQISIVFTLSDEQRLKLKLIIDKYSQNYFEKDLKNFKEDVYFFSKSIFEILSHIQNVGQNNLYKKLPIGRSDLTFGKYLISCCLWLQHLGILKIENYVLKQRVYSYSLEGDVIVSCEKELIESIDITKLTIASLFEKFKHLRNTVKDEFVSRTPEFVSIGEDSNGLFIKIRDIKVMAEKKYNWFSFLEILVNNYDREVSYDSFEKNKNWKKQVVKSAYSSLKSQECMKELKKVLKIESIGNSRKQGGYKLQFI